MIDILIVDDDTDLATTLGEVLELLGNTTRVAFNGEEGLQAIAEHMPDVLLLDVEMPVLDGPSTANRLRTEDLGRELIPIIVSSGFSDIESVAERIGTPYAIKKPYSLDDLMRMVKRASIERRAPHPPVRPFEDDDR
jgi:CheY-like chemotaxis protein